MNNITSVEVTLADGTEWTAPSSAFTQVVVAPVVNEAEVEKLEGEVAAVDAELKADEVTPPNASDSATA
jgi:hypothetical protein